MNSIDQWIDIHAGSQATEKFFSLIIQSHFKNMNQPNAADCYSSWNLLIKHLPIEDTHLYAI